MKQTLVLKQNKFFRLWMMVIIPIGVIILSACSGSIENSPAPTSTPTPTLTPIAEPVQSGDIPIAEPAKTPVDIPTVDPNLEPTATVTVEDVCSLVTAFDVENVLGQTVTSITPGAEPDEISGSTLNYCTYLGSGKAVVISSVEVDNSSIGGDVLRAQVQTIKDEEPATAANEELGVGIQAFWSISEHAGQYTVLTEGEVALHDP